MERKLHGWSTSLINIDDIRRGAEEPNRINRQFLLLEVVSMHLWLVHSSSNVSCLCNFYVSQNVHPFGSALSDKAESTDWERTCHEYVSVASRIKIPNAACILADTWPGYCTCSVSLLRSELVRYKLICLTTLASSSAERPCCDTHRPPLTLLAEEDASCLQANK